MKTALMMKPESEPHKTMWVHFKMTLGLSWEESQGGGRVGACPSREGGYTLDSLPLCQRDPVSHSHAHLQLRITN